jgi:hypothetical protein
VAAAAADRTAVDTACDVVLSLRDVRILVDSTTLQQHVAYFATMPDVRVYTVRGRRAHARGPGGGGGGATARGCPEATVHNSQGLPSQVGSGTRDLCANQQ